MSEPSGETDVITAPTGDATAIVDPAPPEEFVKAAKLAPDHWLYFTDPTWQGEGPPPEWAVVGQWRSNLDGEIVEWQDNDNYRPSPQAQGWPEPVDAVDATIQLASTGYGPGEDVTRALVGAELAVLVTAEGELVRASAPDGTAVIPVFSAPAFLHRYGNLAYELVKTPDIIHRLPEDHSFYVNPSAQVSMVVDTQAVLDAIGETEKPATESTREASVAEEPPSTAPRGDSAGENGPREAEEPEPPAPVRPSTVGGTDVPTTPAATASTEDETAEDETAGRSGLGLDPTS